MSDPAVAEVEDGAAKLAAEAEAKAREFIAAGHAKFAAVVTGRVGAALHELPVELQRLSHAIAAWFEHLMNGPDHPAATPAEPPVPRDETRDVIDGKPAPHMVSDPIAEAGA